MSKLYEFETNRTNISAKQFYSYVAREFKKRTGQDFGWLDDFNTWANPFMPSSHRNPDTKEICQNLPYNYHMYLQNAYNFIMEYDDGHGYCYAVEFER